MDDREGLRLPDFIGVGPARTGTTWLHAMLRQQLGLPRRYKEVHFFDRYYSHGLNWYANHFAEYPRQIKVGEITPHYFYSPLARTRIANDLPECKIVCTFREPAARMYSVYKLMRYQGRITADSFQRALNKHRSIMVNHYRYAYDLRLWLSAFGHEQVLVCLYDDLESEPQAYLNRITDFLGAPRISLADARAGTQRINTVEGWPRRPHLAAMMWRIQRSMDPHQRYHFRRIVKYLGIWQYCFRLGDAFPPPDSQLMSGLREQFKSDIEELEQIIGRDLSAWKGPHASAERRVESSAG